MKTALVTKPFRIRNTDGSGQTAYATEDVAEGPHAAWAVRHGYGEPITGDDKAPSKSTKPDLNKSRGAAPSNKSAKD